MSLYQLVDVNQSSILELWQRLPFFERRQLCYSLQRPSVIIVRLVSGLMSSSTKFVELETKNELQPTGVDSLVLNIW